MPRCRASVSFLFCVGWALSISAAEPARLSSKYRIDGWQLDEGLPQNSVTTVIQSRSGYLWLGTFNGLVRFDGVNFRVYDSDSTPELKGNRISKLIEGTDGSLWIGTDGSGLTHYRNGQFKSVVAHPELSQSSITTMCEDRDGGLWLGTVGGGVVRLKQGQATVFGAEAGLPDASIRSVLEDGNGRIWVGATGFLGFFQQGKLTAIPVDANADVQLGPGRKGTVWVAVGDQLQQTDEHAGLKAVGAIPFPKQRTTITALYEDRRGDLWLGTYGGGLLRHHRGVFENITTADGLSHDTVLCVMEDKEENLWVGTRGGGLSRLKERVFEVLDTKDGLSEEVVLSVCQGPTGNIWIGTDGGGLNCLSNGQFTVYSQKHGLRHQSILGVYEDRQTNLWVGASSGGLYQRRWPSSQFFRRFSLSGRHVQAISEDREGTLWVGTSDGGLNCLRQGPFPRRFTRYSTSDGLSNNDVRVILPDKAGNLWIGTGGGLNRFADEKFTTFHKRDGLPSEVIRTLHADADGALWIGTAGGLCRLKEGKFTAFTQNHGLPVNVITQIFEDGSGNFWIGSAKGVFRVRKRELDEVALGRRASVTCVTYDKTDGLGSRECSGNFQPAGWKTADGRLWFPTIKGIAVVDPNNFKVNKRPPQVVIEEVVADGQRSELAGPGMEDRAVQISPTADQIEFRYTGLSFSAPRRVSFKYRLEGLDKDWVEAGTRRSAYYGQLSPGNYRFHVLAANNDGFWNDVGSSLAVMVPTPYWRTWWFTTLAALALIGAMVGTTRFLTAKQLKRRLELLEHQNAVEKERTRIARDMHDQLGASLTRVGLFSELVRREATAPAAVIAHAGRISETTQEVVKTLDEIVWTVNPKNDTLDKLADYLVHYAEEFFESTPVRCRLDVSADLPNRPLTADVRHNLFLAFKEALNNLLRHAEATEAWVRLTIINDRLELTVKDNGRGFDANADDLHGNGLPNLRKRLEEIHGRFELRSAPGQGSILTFSIPLDR